jgi:hypothetical protein
LPQRKSLTFAHVKDVFEGEMRHPQPKSFAAITNPYFYTNYCFTMECNGTNPVYLLLLNLGFVPFRLLAGPGRHIAPFTLLIALIALSAQVQAQKPMTWRGTLDLAGDQYHAEYDYTISRGDTARNGPFRLQKLIPLQADSRQFDFMEMEGRFKADLPVNRWDIRWGQLMPAGTGRIDDYHLHLPLTGVERVFHLGLDEQQQVRGWKFLSRDLLDRVSADTLLDASSMLRESEHVFDVVIQSGSARVTGTHDHNYRLIGLWHFGEVQGDVQAATGIWDFRDAYLRSIEVRLGSVTKSIPFIGREADGAVPKNLPLTDSLFHILRLAADYGMNSPEHQAKLEAHILLLAQSILGMEEGLSHFSKIAPTERQPLGVTLYTIPLSTSEKRALDRIKSSIDACSQHLELLSGDPQISLARISNELVGHFLAVSERIAGVYLEPLEAVLNLDEKHMLGYIDRQPVARRAIPVVGTYLSDNDQRKPYSFSRMHTNPLDKLEGLEGLSQWADLIRLELEDIRDSIAFHLREYQQEETLLARERELIKLYDQSKLALKTQLDPELNDLAGSDILAGLDSFVETKLRQYSSLKNSRDKARFVESFITCFQNFNRLINTLEYVPENARSIRDAYRRDVFNPYTFTNMEEILKPQIIRAFNQVLLPALLHNISRMTCEDVVAIHTNFDRLFESMTTTLQQETRRTERRLRKISDSTKAAEILNFNLYFN